jgi:hypothetical protein
MPSLKGNVGVTITPQSYQVKLIPRPLEWLNFPHERSTVVPTCIYYYSAVTGSGKTVFSRYPTI